MLGMTFLTELARKIAEVVVARWQRARRKS